MNTETKATAYIGYIAEMRAKKYLNFFSMTGFIGAAKENPPSVKNTWTCLFGKRRVSTGKLAFRYNLDDISDIRRRATNRSTTLTKANYANW